MSGLVAGARSDRSDQGRAVGDMDDAAAHPGEQPGAEVTGPVGGGHDEIGVEPAGDLPRTTVRWTGTRWSRAR